MISLFRKIRQKLLQENRVTRYLVYALGEIFLVVIGILIALQVNNWNENRKQEIEKTKLTASLGEEIKSNLAEFKSHRAYLEKCEKELRKIMAVSANQEKNLSVDSIRSLSSSMLPVMKLSIGQSRLNAAKATESFGLLSEEQSRSITNYETYIEDYQGANEALNIVFTEEGNEFLIRFSKLDEFFQRTGNQETLARHPYFEVNDAEFIEFLQKPTTYSFLHRTYLGVFTEILWLKALESLSTETLLSLEAEATP
jgi:hypothetical protein